MYAVGVAGVFIFVQFLEGNFITPQIVGSKISINGLVAIIALLLGSALWGISGMALSLPTIAILKVIFDNVEGLKPYGYVLGEPDHELILPHLAPPGSSDPPSLSSSCAPGRGAETLSATA